MSGVIDQGSAFDRGVGWLHRRAGRWLVEVVLLLIGVWMLVLIVPAYSALTFAIFDATTALFLRVLVTFEISTSVGLLVTAFLTYRSAADARRWLNGDRSAAAARAAHRWLLAGLPRMVRLGCAILCVSTIPSGVYIARHIGMSAVGQAAYLALLVLLVIGAAVFIYLGLEQLLRPLLREVLAAQDLGDSPVRGVSLQSKVLILVPLFSLYSGVIIASVNTNSLDRDHGLALAVVVSLVTSAVIAGGLTFLLKRSLLDRLVTLGDALAQVAQGDYDTRLASVYGDELDDVVRGYNEMTMRLGAHDVQMQASRARIVAAADDSRRRVERDLHDGAQQYLVLMQLKLGMLAKAVAGDEKASALAGEVRSDLSTALAELRDLAHGLYPAVLESEGLTAALKVAGQRSPLTTVVDGDGVGRCGPEVEAAVYFCCLEAMQNAAKHAGDSASVTVRLTQDSDRLRFSVVDDGSGYDSTSTAPSGGLQNMADRIGALGGTLTVESCPGAGTTVAGAVPGEPQ